MLHHILFAEKVEVGSAILLRKYDILGQISYDFHVKLLILVVDFRDAFETLDKLAGKKEKVRNGLFVLEC